MKKTLFSAGKSNVSATLLGSERKKGRIDAIFLLILSSILFLGTFMIFSASYPYASAHYNDGTYYIKRQIMGIIAHITTRIYSLKQL